MPVHASQVCVDAETRKRRRKKVKYIKGYLSCHKSSTSNRFRSKGDDEKSEKQHRISSELLPRPYLLQSPRYSHIKIELCKVSDYVIVREVSLNFHSKRKARFENRKAGKWGKRKFQIRMIQI